MENQKKSNSILLIILVILVVGLGGFIVYDKVLKNDKTNTNSNCQNQNISEKSNSFELFKNNLIKERNKKYDPTNDVYLFNSSSLDKMNVHYSLSLSKEGVLTFDSFDINNKTKTIADKVLLFNVASIGNGGQNLVYFIKEDGTVSAWCVDCYLINHEDTEVENNIGNFKNIISIIPGGISYGDSNRPDSPTSDVGTPAFVDINGNIFVPYQKNLPW